MGNSSAAYEQLEDIIFDDHRDKPELLANVACITESVGAYIDIDADPEAYWGECIIRIRSYATDEGIEI